MKKFPIFPILIGLLVGIYMGSQVKITGEIYKDGEDVAVTFMDQQILFSMREPSGWRVWLGDYQVGVGYFWPAITWDWSENEETYLVNREHRFVVYWKVAESERGNEYEQLFFREWETQTRE